MRKISPAESFASPADRAACRRLLRGGSRTFFTAGWVLPAGVRAAATGLYAFCRTADDAIDHGDDRREALRDLRDRLARLHAGSPGAIPADRAFADVIKSHAIPRSFPEALLEGFEWDAMNRRYETLAELHAYAVRVAGVVGAMMAMIMGVRETSMLARACDLGVAMQLTNIARDVGEDARCGRLYLPRAWLRDAGVDPDAWLRAPVFNAAIATVIERMLAEADSLYVRSEAGLARLPASCRPGMYAARLLYAEIGHELRRRRWDAVEQRAVVAWPRKAALVACAVGAALRARGALRIEAARSVEEALPQADFLLAALHPGNPAALPERRPRISDRVVWVVDLFERLERREQSARLAS